MNALLLYYGTPYNESEIRSYYSDILQGREPSEALLADLRERYRIIGKSPLNEITFSLAHRLEGRLNQRINCFTAGLTSAPGARAACPGARVYVGAKHGSPRIPEVVRQMIGDGVRRAVVVVIAPHYSLRSTAEYRERVEGALLDYGKIDVLYTPEYYDHPEYISLLAARLNRAFWRVRKPENAAVYFSAHSIPESAVSIDGGIYPRQVEATARATAQRLGLERWRVVWQSAGRSGGNWIGPDINDALREDSQRGIREVVVAAIGFPADHLEVLYDIDIEARHTAQQNGISLVRVESLNDADDYVNLLANLVEATWYGDAV